MTAGMSPAGDLMTAAVQIATMGLWRFVGLIYIQYFYSVVHRNDGDRLPSAAAVEDAGGAPYVALDGTKLAGRTTQRRTSRPTVKS